MASRFILPYADIGEGIKPASGAKLYFYDTGTSTPKDTYSDSAATTPNTNPVVANSSGVFGDIWIEGAYRVVLRDSRDIQIWEADPVESVDTSDLTSTNGTERSLVGWVDVQEQIFDTVADMVADTALSVGDIVSTAGYSAVGDGGANRYEVVAAGTGTADGGTYINLATHQAKGLFPDGEHLVEQWGVDGTASAADFAAWESAINYAKSTKTELVCTSGKTYLFDPTTNTGPNNGLTAAMKDNEGLFIDGRNCEWKFKDGGVTDQFQHMLLVVMRTLFGSTNQTADYFELKNVTLNGNQANNTPPSPSAWEQSSAVKVQVLRNEGNELKHVRFSNIRQVDPVADTILIGPSEAVSSGEAGILNATVDGFHAGARNSTRSTVICGSGVSRVNLSNFTVEEIAGSEKNSIETEFTSIGTQTCVMNMTNIHIDDIELGGLAGSEDQIQVNMTNVTTDRTGFFLPVRCNVKASNCDLTVGIVNNWRMPRFEASNCTFRHLVFDDGGTNDVRTIANLSETSTTDWQFDNCKFLVEGTPAVGANNYAFDTGNLTADPANYKFKFNNCYFDPAFGGTFDAYAGGTVISSNCVMAGTNQAVICGSFSTFQGGYESINDDWTGVTGTTFEAAASVAPTGDMRFTGGKWSTLNYATSSSQWPALLSLGGRKIQATAAPTGGGIIGDQVNLDAASYASAASADPVEWKCVDSSPTAATWVATVQKP